MKVALITGATGFVGEHLTHELISNGYKVHRASRLGFNSSMQMDLSDYGRVRSVIRRTNPDVIFHLAAIAFVPTSWQNPELVFQVNTIGTLHLFDAVRSLGVNPVIHIAGSSEEYGLVYEKEIPINEKNPLRPQSPYAVSKIAMDFLAYQYNKSYGMNIIRTRAFNHEGYGRGEQYMPSSFAKQIVQIECGLKEPMIMHGDLSSKRDITDVRDMVIAYRLATEYCKPGDVYNIGSGEVVSAQEVLETLISLSSEKHPALAKVRTQEDKSRLRPSDVKILQCDSSKFRELTGWKPKYTLRQTLSEELRYWREKIGGDKNG